MLNEWIQRQKGILERNPFLFHVIWLAEIDHGSVECYEIVCLRIINSAVATANPVRILTRHSTNRSNNNMDATQALQIGAIFEIFIASLLGISFPFYYKADVYGDGLLHILKATAAGIMLGIAMV